MSQPSRWLVVTADAPSAELAPLLAEELALLGGAVIEDSPTRFTTYLQPPEGEIELHLAGLRRELAERVPGGIAGLAWRWQEAEDWSAQWKRGLGPRKVSPRLVVKPTWSSWAAAAGEVVIELDPEMAFGTGEHPSTRGCLRLLDDAIRPGDRVLDIGSGSAILSIAAARLGAGEVIAVEYDTDANLNAHDNLERNGVADRVRILEAMGDPALLASLGQFDLILANILSGIIRPLLPAFRAALGSGSGGRLIVSGILWSEHAEVVREAERVGLRLERVDDQDADFEGQWWTALLVPAPVDAPDRAAPGA